MVSKALTPEKYYRLPWNLADNAITWLEPTTCCNLACEGCYREKGDHRPLEDVIAELESIKQLRKTDGISIAGGEPLLYPQLLDLVRHVVSQGWKPIIITNGTQLNPELIKELKEAGLMGFTVHVDSHQNRPGWTGKSETELNELRSQIAQMIHEAGEGKIACAFNATIYRDTLPDIPALTSWAREHNDIVHTMVYILFRSAKSQSGFDAYVNGAAVDPTALVYQLDNQEEHQDVMAQEVVDQMREALPDYEPCAFLNGTEDPRAFKWLLGMAMGPKGKYFSYLDNKFAEFIQAGHHLLYGTYIAYARPCWARNMQVIFPLALFSRGLRKALWQWLTKPLDMLKSLYIQSFMIIQPVDVFADGRISMCDGCPDSMFYKGRMVWKCRVDELQKFGGFVQCVPRDKSDAAG
jgi:MoaA/NifB/PqqE/SkfB family radical SAM enzyme